MSVLLGPDWTVAWGCARGAVEFPSARRRSHTKTREVSVAILARLPRGVRAGPSGGGLRPRAAARCRSNSPGILRVSPLRTAALPDCGLSTSSAGCLGMSGRSSEGLWHDVSRCCGNSHRQGLPVQRAAPFQRIWWPRTRRKHGNSGWPLPRGVEARQGFLKGPSDCSHRRGLNFF